MSGLVQNQVQPAYPPVARAAHISGAVVLHVIISKDGSVKDLSVVSGPDLLRSSALAAVSHWTYRPYLLNGAATDVDTTVVVNFALEGIPATASDQAGNVSTQDHAAPQSKGSQLATDLMATNAKEDISKLDFTTLQQRATQGDTAAEDELAFRYFAGRGVPQNYSQSYAWANKAASAGDAGGQEILGELYLNGIGVEQDYAQSRIWLSKAAKQGRAEAKLDLGGLYEQGYGVTRDYAQAFIWYFAAAAQGNKFAQLAVGRAYEAGQGVQQSYTQALQWYKKAADQGDANAEEHLGNMYRDGLGVPSTFATARVWYQKAADQNDPNAKALLVNLDDLEKQQRAFLQQQVTAQQPAAVPIAADPFVAETDLPLVPLPAIPANLFHHLPKYDQEDRYPACIVTPATKADAMRAGGQCQRLGLSIAIFGNDGWGQKHGTGPIADSLFHAARVRACALGDGLACAGIARDLNAAGMHDAALHVISYKPCQANDKCRDHALDAPSSAAYQPKPSGGGFLAVMGAINEGLSTVTANADPNGIEDAKNQGLSNINAVTARNQQIEQERQTAARLKAEQEQAFASSLSSSARPQAASADTGTAPPANCYYLSPSQPCVPLAQYQQMQAQKQANVQGICPASGFVPGVMLRQVSDVAVGVACKPGTPYGPLIATTASGGYTGVTPPDPALAGPSGSASGSSTTGGPFDPDLDNCVVYFYKNDPITGDHLFLQNNCSVRAQVYFYASPQVHGGVAIDPGEVDNTYAAHDQIIAAGNLSIYACPANDTPRQPDGSLAYNGVNNRFLCSRN